MKIVKRSGYTTIRMKSLQLILPIIFIGLLIIMIIVINSNKESSIAFIEEYSEVSITQANMLIRTKVQGYKSKTNSLFVAFNTYEDYINKADRSESLKRKAVMQFSNIVHASIPEVSAVCCIGLDESAYYFDIEKQSGEIPDGFEDVLVFASQCWNNKTSCLVWKSFSDNESTIYFIRLIKSTHDLSTQGILIIGLDYAAFTASFHSLKYKGRGGYAVFKRDNEMLTCDKEYRQILKIYCDLYPNWREENEGDFYKINGATWFISSKYNASDDLNVVYVISKADILRDFNSTQRMLCCIFFCLLIGLIITTSFATKIIEKDINSLVVALEDQSASNTMKEIHSKTALREVAYFMNAYNFMVRSVNASNEAAREFEKQAKDAEYAILEAEYHQLQAMINPHFIFNAMESMNGLAKMKGVPEISDMCCSMSRLLRISLGRHGKLIPLTEELQFIEDYVRVENYAHIKNIELVLDLCEETKNWLVPPFILQPIVENSIIHGFTTLQECSIIYISTHKIETQTDNICVISISDNGIGMPQKITEELTQNADEFNTNHFGIRSIIRRLRIIYGEGATLEIHSVHGQGVNIEIRIPYTQPEKINYEKCCDN